MDDGRLTDSQGRRVDFKNTIIVMTSNVGARNITETRKQMGFDSGGGTEDRNAEIRSFVMSDLKRTFKPEFLNRVDDTIVFHQLTKEDIAQIARNMLDTVAERMTGVGVTLRYTEEAAQKLGEAGFDPAYGARPLRRTIQNLVEDAAAEQLLSGELASGDAAEVTVRDGEIRVSRVPED